MKTTYNSEIHGYRFPNRFEKNWPNSIVKLILGNSIYGLCGGMVFSSLDCFLNQQPLIPIKTVADLEAGFIQHLWERQFASMPIRNYFLLVNKALQNDDKLFQNTINIQVPAIIEKINANQPAPIIVIRTKDLNSLMDNHQILLTGYEINGGVTQFTCYDPNHPLKTTLLIVNRQSGEEHITQSTNEKVRGFFLNRYKKKNPS
jgi:hypothetical protein